MEEKIKNAIYSIYRQYGADKASDYTLRESRILNICMNDLTSSPELEKELDTEEKIHYFVMQNILFDISTEIKTTEKNYFIEIDFNEKIDETADEIDVEIDKTEIISKKVYVGDKIILIEPKTGKPAAGFVYKVKKIKYNSTETTRDVTLQKNLTLNLDRW